MATQVSGPPPEALVERFQELNAGLENISDPVVRQRAEEMISVVLDLYGEGLTRIFEALNAAVGTEELRQELADDGVVASLMLIHDLYPVAVTERVGEALQSVRPYMESHGGDVELLGVADGIARIKLSGSCDGCPASAATLELAIKQALDEHAPDLEGLEVEGAVSGPEVAEVSGTELPIVQLGSVETTAVEANGALGTAANGGPTKVEALPSWFPLRDLGELGDGEMRPAAVAGNALMVANVEGSLLAYLDRCADCGSGLGGSTLIEGVLCCSDCGRRYYLPRAGRSLDDDGLQLDPVPLLAEGNSIRVAIAT